MWRSSASSPAAITHHAGDGAEIGGVVVAGMGRAVGADIAGAVDGEAHRQVLHGDVVDHLVVGALQEGRVDRAERLQPLGGEAGREGHGVLLGDADVEDAGREDLGELVEAGARGHRGGHRDDAVVVLGFVDQARGEDRRCRTARCDGALACAPVMTLNLATPWYLSAASSAGA